MPTNTWNAAANGVWSATGNWDAGHIPLSSEDAVADATSTKNCTVDTAAVCKSLDFSAAGYTGIFTISPTFSLTVGGTFKPPATAAKFVAVGSTLTLSGATGNIGTIYDTGATSGSTLCVVTVSANCTYTWSNSGFAGVDASIYGTLTGANELNIQRTSATNTTKLRIKSTGRITGSGSIVFGFGAQLLEQSGTIDCGGIGAYRTTSTASMIAATYDCSQWIYALAASPSPYFKYSAGTYYFAGTFFGSQSDSGDVDPTEYCRLDMSAGAVVNSSAPTVSFKYLSGRLGEAGCVNGGGLFKFSACTAFTPPRDTAVVLENLEFSGGAPVVTTNDLNTVSLLHSGGTFSFGGKAATIRDDWALTGGNFTAAGFAGSTITVNGNVRLHGTGGNVLLMNPNSGWNLVLSGGPDYTYVVEHATIKNLTVTGGTLVAVNCTDAGSNTGVTFTNTATPSDRIIAGIDGSAYDGTSPLLEARLSGSTIPVYVNGALLLTVTSTLNQTTARHGLDAYKDADYGQCAIDDFRQLAPTDAPPAPTLAGSVTGLMSWNAVVSTTAYSLERSVSGAGSYSVLNSPTQSTLSYQDTLSPGVDYDYRIRAQNANGYGSYSNVVTVVGPTLVGYWTLDEASGNRADSSGQSHPMVPTNTPGNAAGKISNALALVAASSQNCAAANHADFNAATSFSVAGWFYHNGSQADFTDWCIIGKGNPFGAGALRGWQIFTRNAARSLKVTLAPAGGGAIVTIAISNITATAWHHVVLTWNAATNTASVYLDGGAAVTGTVTGGMSNTSDDLTLGAIASSEYWDGRLDEWAYFAGHVLTSGEVAQLYNSGAGVTYPLPF